MPNHNFNGITVNNIPICVKCGYDRSSLIGNDGKLMSCEVEDLCNGNTATDSNIADMVASLKLIVPLIQEMYKKTRRHVITNSGSVTGINTPPVNQGPINVGGDRLLSPQEYIDAKRYFEFFKEAIARNYPSGGYSIVYNDKNGMCSILGQGTAPAFKFKFEPAVIKDHYCTFRLSGDNIDNYLVTARAQSESGVPNNFSSNLVTPLP